MASQLSTAHFLRVLLLTFTAACLVAALVNFTVDPYGIFVTPRISGFNEVKPKAAERVRVAKPYMAEAATARTIIGGNSRPELGLDPRSECWALEHQPVFNMGVPGASFRSQVEYVQRAVVSTNADRVLFAVDFLDFLVDTRQRQLTPAPPTEESKQATEATNQATEIKNLFERFRDYFNGLFSLETLADSFATFLMQHNTHAATRRSDGFNPAQDYIPIIRTEGQAVLFQQKNSEVARLFSRAGLGLYNMGAANSEPLEALNHFLGWADSNDIEVVVLINPYHAHYLALIKIAGKWDLLEQWKRDILAIASAHKAELWDFNALDSFNSESPPGPGKAGRIHPWFWEPAHYRKEYGDLMLARIEGQRCQPVNSLPEVGVLLTPDDLERHLSDIRSALNAYRATKYNEYSKLLALIPGK